MGATTDKIKGRAQQIEGKLTGDKIRMAQGTATRAKGKVEGAARRISRKVKAGVRRATAGMRRAAR